MTTRLKLGAQILAVGLVASLLALLIWKLAQGSGNEAKVGKAAPDFSLRRIDAPGTLQLASLRGKVVVLNFWASWCYPCTQEAPPLDPPTPHSRHPLLVLPLALTTPPAA